MSADRSSRRHSGGTPSFLYAVLDDSFEDDRERGIEMGLNDLRRSNEYLLVLVDGKLSSGMKRELAEAARLNMRGHIISVTHEKMRQAMKVVR